MRLHSVLFHPVVDELLVTTSAGNVVRFFDTSAAEASALQLTALEQEILSLDINPITGTEIMTLTKDLHCRCYDPRVSPDPITTFPVADVAKGLSGCFLGDTGLFGINTHFFRDDNKWLVDVSIAGRRAFAPCDIDNKPSSLRLFFDVNNSLVDLAGRGDNFFPYDVWETPRLPRQTRHHRRHCGRGDASDAAV